MGPRSSAGQFSDLSVITGQIFRGPLVVYLASSRQTFLAFDAAQIIAVGDSPTKHFTLKAVGGFYHYLHLGSAMSTLEIGRRRRHHGAFRVSVRPRGWLLLVAGLGLTVAAAAVALRLDKRRKRTEDLATDRGLPSLPDGLPENPPEDRVV